MHSKNSLQIRTAAGGWTNALRRLLLMALAPICLASFSSPLAFGDLVLDFEGLGLANNEPIPSTYGDSPGIDVSYTQLDGFGNATTLGSLLFWNADYGDLMNVVWGSGRDETRVGEIRIESLDPSVQLTLNSFDAADWDGSASDETFRVYDGSYNLLFEMAGVDVDDVLHNAIAPNVSSQTLILQWSFPWAVGLDNISFSASPATAVPEPSSLCFAALFGVAVMILRRRSAPPNNADLSDCCV